MLVCRDEVGTLAAVTHDREPVGAFPGLKSVGDLSGLLQLLDGRKNVQDPSL
jgi:hypothetical protein